MGFISFVGRVLFASLFLLSAYQEYVSPLLPRLARTPLRSRLVLVSSARRQIEAAPFPLGRLSVGCFRLDLALVARVRTCSIEILPLRCGDAR